MHLGEHHGGGWRERFTVPDLLAFATSFMCDQIRHRPPWLLWKYNGLFVLKQVNGDRSVRRLAEQERQIIYNATRLIFPQVTSISQMLDICSQSLFL